MIGIKLFLFLFSIELILWNNETCALLVSIGEGFRSNLYNDKFDLIEDLLQVGAPGILWIASSLLL
jgi:hypothetical protein